jgi:TetR/AcrR family transcriptional regulator
MEHLSQTEQKIYEAATRVFIHHGRDGARMEDIAKEAGINKALLHYYFRSKDKLYSRVFEREVRKVVADLFLSINLELDIRTFLHTFIDNYIDRLHQNPAVVQFMLWEMRSSNTQISEIIKSIFTVDRYSPPQEIVQKLRRAVKNREIRRLDAHQLLFNIISMCIYTFIAEPIISSLFPELKVREKSFIEKRKDEIYNLIWNGIKP